ncbi:hypothetical protein [Paenibacillus sp. GP183]|uniref:hypothetical protein n=1 Tax=Paenibacillus sp. GP183 TaxID=1882751 RepID=UPI000899E88C|nr:hypothetical protein [Paenibacillus sp. GP183]SEC33821.1 hypothetical protein SAMN05443246_3759 [Paenibacillus sp. GP183]
MNLKLKSLLISAGIMLIIPIYSISQADAPAPGSATDPVITKSYFDQNTLTQDQVKQLIAQSGGSGGSALMVVQLQSGQTLYASSGSEFIVRTGKTVAVSKDEDGIPDVTAGKDIRAGAAIENNHHLIFPRDTRGIKPATNNTAEIFVMVRGNYSLFNADGSKVTP